MALPSPLGFGGFEKVEHPLDERGHPRVSSDGGPSGVRVPKGDEFVEALHLQPSFVNIDVEGAEFAVLQGLSGTLREHRPTVMVEIHPEWQPAGSSVDLIHAFKEELRYRSVEIESDALAIRQLWQS
jgi:hypothetical protein